jgi:hypothetical protein
VRPELDLLAEHQLAHDLLGPLTDPTTISEPVNKV